MELDEKDVEFKLKVMDAIVSINGLVIDLSTIVQKANVALPKDYLEKLESVRLKTKVALDSLNALLKQ